MTLSYDFALRVFTDTLKWLSSLPILMNNRSEDGGTALGIILLLTPPRGISLSPFHPGDQTKSSQLTDAGSRVECPWNDNNNNVNKNNNKGNL